VFHLNNCNIILFLCYIKNYIEILHVFINAYNLYYILLHVSIDLLIHGYIFTRSQKNMLITLAHELVCVRKKKFDLLQGELNRRFNSLFFAFMDTNYSRCI
jgi:hypothetical protein